MDTIFTEKDFAEEEKKKGSFLEVEKTGITFKVKNIKQKTTSDKDFEQVIIEAVSPLDIVGKIAVLRLYKLYPKTAAELVKACGFCEMSDDGKIKRAPGFFPFHCIGKEFIADSVRKDGNWLEIVNFRLKEEV